MHAACVSHAASIRLQLHQQLATAAEIALRPGPAQGQPVSAAFTAATNSATVTV